MRYQISNQTIQRNSESDTLIVGCLIYGNCRSSTIRMYIIAQNENGMFMIDQHAAQERIKYEYFREKLAK